MYPTRFNLVVILIMVLTSLGLAQTGQAASLPTEVPPPPTLVILGQEVAGDVPPTIVEGRTLVPIRLISETLGAKVDWLPETRSVTVDKGEDHVELTIGVQDAAVNQGTVQLDVPPQIIQSRTMVPLRFIAEALGMKVDWDGTTRTVSIGLYTISAVELKLQEEVPSFIFQSDGPIQYRQASLAPGLFELRFRNARLDLGPNRWPEVPSRFFSQFKFEQINGSSPEVVVTFKQVIYLEPLVSYADKKVYLEFMTDLVSVGSMPRSGEAGAQAFVATGLPVWPVINRVPESNQVVLDFPNTRLARSPSAVTGTSPIKKISTAPGLLPGWSRVTFDLEGPVVIQYALDRSANRFNIFFKIRQETPPAGTTGGKIVFLDPGHGGAETGAKAAGGLKEKDVNLGISLRLRDLLVAGGFNVIMSRSDDRTVGLFDRPKTANDSGAEVFVSIHNNASTDSRDNGTEIWYYNSNPGSPRLAGSIRAALKRGVGLRDRGVKNWEPFVVVKYTTMPAVLVEGAFLSNPNEAALLASPDFRQRVARAIYDGILGYFGQ